MFISLALRKDVFCHLLHETYLCFHLTILLSSVILIVHGSLPQNPMGLGDDIDFMNITMMATE
jgi:hypothetical protein